MAILVDEPLEYAHEPYGYRFWCHMMTDNRTPEGLEELHAFAKRLGLRRGYFQKKNPKWPHYDLGQKSPDRGIRQRALALGAESVESRILLERCAWTIEKGGTAHADSADL